MKYFSFIIVCLLIGFTSCGQKIETANNTPLKDSKVSKKDSTPESTPKSVDASDSTNSNPSVVAKIQKALTGKLLTADLNSIPKEERFFYYKAFDLNSDGKDEYFVGFSSPYFCGTGGCSGYILNNDGSLITKFSVTDFPIYVAAGNTGGWRDLIFNSNGEYHDMKSKNGKYPSNPSVAEKWNGENPEKAPAILDIYKLKYPKFAF
jgi:hypothetical protein